MSNELWSMLVLATGLGMMHALDADHIVAVSGLSCAPDKARQSLVFCSRWALGHGSALLLIGSLVVLLGMAIPYSISHTAEQMVGVVLVLIGLQLIWKQVYMPSAENRNVQHAPTFVGLLHGTAGTAPLLALLPLSKMQPWQALVYLLMFGLGVFVVMLLFGGFLGRLMMQLKAYKKAFTTSLQLFIALLAISYGGVLLLSSMTGG